FYGPSHDQVNETMEHADRAVGERELGIDPASGKMVIARLGRFGPMVQIGHNDDTDEKPRFTSLKRDQSIATITLEQALDLFKLPFNLDDYEGQEVMVGTGRFGPYVKWGDKFISVPKHIDPLTITNEVAISIIKEKQAADAPVGHYKGEPITK